ncbi:MAG: metallophosphoesterase family protein [Proteobacteria bacterium]|nr:metallophosphoesterase family protein [Pseudomonadota bacterium]
MSFKWVLYSDIHGQIPQLDAVQEAVKKEEADKVVVIGDLVGLGPEPAEVIERIKGMPEIEVIIGNVDLWVTRNVWEWGEPKSPHQEWMFRMMQHTQERISKDLLEWLDKRPYSITYSPELGHDFHIFHATPYEIGDEEAFPFRLTDDEIAEKLEGYDFDIGAHGHIHGPSVRNFKKSNGKMQKLVCAAAVGMSWDGDPRPSYAVVEYHGDGKWDARVERVEFDCEKQADFNENSWIEHGERIAGMIRSGTFWNPDHMPH